MSNSDSSSYLNVRRASAKWPKEDRHGYLHTDIKSSVATKKKSKFYQQIYIQYVFIGIALKKKNGIQAQTF